MPDIVITANTNFLSFVEVVLKQNRYLDKNSEYIFEKDDFLSKIIVYLEDGEIVVEFLPIFNMNKGTKDFLQSGLKK